MPQFLDQRDPGFEAAFARLIDRAAGSDTAADAAAAEIIADVRRRGLDAVLELTARFDRIDLTRETIAFSEAEIDEAVAAVPAEEREALELAAARIRAYHERQRP